MQDEPISASCSDASGSSSSSVASNTSTLTSFSKTSGIIAASSSSPEAVITASTAPANPNPPKKTRSQSPGAVQRRRIQNRIAQRNHRQKVKERAAEQKERLAREQAADQTAHQAHIGLSSRSSSTGSVSSNSSITNYPVHHLHPNGGLPHHPHQHSIRPSQSPIQIPGARFQAPAMMNSFGDDMSKSWVPDPTLMPTPDGDLAAFTNEYLNMSCSCNSMTGPCAQHREEMRVQLMSFMSSAQNQPQAQPRPMSNHKKNSFSNTMEDVMLDKLMQPPLPSPPLFPEMPPQVDPSRSSNTAGFRRSTICSQGSSPASPRDAANSAATATNTSRFKAILTFVRAAGFPDFDSMVTSYYTSEFQKNSVAELAQRSSRGRRLGQVLESLQESSSKWTVWESRGYRETVTESAQSMYVQELEQVIKRTRRLQQQQQNMHTQANPDVMMFGAADAEMSSEASSGSIGGPGSLASLSSGAGPEEMQRVFQDNLPNLWALLTELAGTHGMQCDRVALASLLLLYNARQNPDIDMDELVHDWRNPEGLADIS
ncbi:hypothetical protein VP1G_08283 [Cytospora mali]|uniref:BZIP domain-containing protein n=1 Tax=Cytospora mali TaxID=578113 RepID=A0A194VAQ0_CYTMA|nr:hypothetical protein VP1G_08283 [Valsa mali var. pyri (nom. inval.)]